MSGLQTVIDNAASIAIDRRKVVGIQVTRNEVSRTNQTPTLQPWRFSITLPSKFRYSEARALLEELDTLDRNVPQIVKFNNNPEMNWIFSYQGSVAFSLINNLTVQSFVGKTLTLTSLPGVSPSTILFRKNDFIQIGNNPYPFTVEQTVTRGSGTTVEVITHRPNILTSSIVGNTIKVGSDCEFNLFCPNMPTYRLKPGGATFGRFNRTTNNALIEFSSEFNLVEWVSQA